MKSHNSKSFKSSFVKCWVIGIGHFEIVTVCVHLSVSMNNGRIRDELSEGKIAICDKTVSLRCGNISDSNSASSKVLVSVQRFQFHDMLTVMKSLFRKVLRSEQTAYTKFTKTVLAIESSANSQQNQSSICNYT